jgi:hypothetical protein
VIAGLNSLDIFPDLYGHSARLVSVPARPAGDNPMISLVDADIASANADASNFRQHLIRARPGNFDFNQLDLPGGRKYQGFHHLFHETASISIVFSGSPGQWLSPMLRGRLRSLL